MHKIEVLIDGKKALEKEVEHVEPKEVVETIKMILDYAKLHKGSNIGMLQGLGGLR